MAGVVGEINNNLLGLQALARGREELMQQRDQITKDQQASELLRRFNASQSSGAPDYEAINQAMTLSPQISSRFLGSVGITDAMRGRDAADYAVRAYGAIDNPDEFMSLTQQRIDNLRAQGRDSSHSEKALQAYLNGDKEKVRQGTKMLAASLAGQGYLDKGVFNSVFGMGGSGSNNDLESWNHYTKGLSPEDLNKATRIKLGLDPRAVGSSDITIADKGLTDDVGNSKSNIAGKVKGSETQAKTAAERRSLWKDQGLAAAENIPTLTRALELQQQLDTGGGADSLRRVANYLGVSSSDSGELNALFSQNILGQLKSTFGGNPTEGEREALREAQASYKQTGKINAKLLKNALKMAQVRADRGRRAALAEKDQATADEIDLAIQISYGDDDNPRQQDDQQASPNTFTGEDQKAYDWAKANPNDPRAAAILQRLEVQ